MEQMERYNICITDLAERDILEGVRYITSELCAVEAALKLLDEIDEAISALSFMPQRYALVLNERPSQSRLSKGYCEKLYRFLLH